MKVKVLCPNIALMTNSAVQGISLDYYYIKLSESKGKYQTQLMNPGKILILAQQGYPNKQNEQNQLSPDSRAMQPLKKTINKQFSYIRVCNKLIIGEYQQNTLNTKPPHTEEPQRYNIRPDTQRTQPKDNIMNKQRSTGGCNTQRPTYKNKYIHIKVLKE